MFSDQASYDLWMKMTTMKAHRKDIWFTPTKQDTGFVDTHQLRVPPVAVPVPTVSEHTMLSLETRESLLAFKRPENKIEFLQLVP